MGNDQTTTTMASSNSTNNNSSRCKSATMFAVPSPPHIGNREDGGDGTRPQPQRLQLQQNCGTRSRRRSSCAIMQQLPVPPLVTGAGAIQHHNQQQAHCPWKEVDEEHNLPTQKAFTDGRHFLAPLSPTVGRCSSNNSNRRNRRMSVAGDQQDTLRREMARAAGGGIGTSLSTGGTPQRRFSRATTSNCGANSATIALVTRKMSELAAGTASETTVHEHLKLSSYQLHILQQSWPRIRSSGAFANAFKDLAHKNASAKEMFQKMSIVEGFSSGKCCDQKEHGRQLGELFDFALQNLNGPSRLVQDRCYRMGEQHFTVFGTGNEAQLWDDLGESISHALAKTESVRGKREAFRAWITLTNFLVESMRVGYTQQFKRRSLHRHSSSSQVVVQLATLDELSPSVPAMMAARHRSHTPTVPLTTL